MTENKDNNSVYKILVLNINILFSLENQQNLDILSITYY